jgi:glycosyltransferase involved in cell wall biosynthesis
MDKQHCVLTVAIPTFNGAATLNKALDSVMSELEAGVEVLVVDNCSDQDLKAIFSEHAGRYNNLRYLRNSENIGFDRNVDLAMREAKGDFVWVLGDDDIILPGGIREVLSIIAANPESGAIYVDCPHPIKLPKGAEGVCRGGDDFFARTRFKNGFVSTNVFNKKLWSEVDVSKYLDTGWVHMGFLMEALPRSPSYVTEHMCVDYIRDGTAAMRWGADGSFIYAGLKLIRVVRQMPAKFYSRRTRRMAYGTVKGGYWRNIPLAKAKGLQIGLPLLADFACLYKGFLTFWVFDLPLLLCPSVVFKILYKLYKSSFR